jgi:hypothetical protein
VNKHTATTSKMRVLRLRLLNQLINEFMTPPKVSRCVYTVCIYDYYLLVTGAVKPQVLMLLIRLAHGTNTLGTS